MPERTLGWRTLLAYGVLALPLAALNLPLYVYLPTFYSAGLGLDLAAVGAVLLAARLFDTVIDPLMGELGDRLRTPWGQRRPWLVLGAPLLLFASWKLFMPAEGAGIGYLLLWSCLAYVAWTALLLTYAAWGAELTGAYHERSRVTGVREGFVIAGILLAASLPAVAGVAPESREALALVFQSMLVLLPLTLVVLLLGVREPPPARQAELPFVQGLKLAWSNEPFRRLILAFFLNGIANGLPATLFLLFVRHVLGADVDAGPLLLLYFVSGMLAVPGWLWLSYRIGKHRAWAASMLWACVMFAWVPFLGQGDALAFAAICVLSGASLGADLAIPASMQADVIDLDRVDERSPPHRLLLRALEHGQQAGARNGRRHRLPGPGRHRLLGRGLQPAARACWAWPCSMPSCPSCSSSRPRHSFGASRSMRPARRSCGHRSKPPTGVV